MAILFFAQKSAGNALNADCFRRIAAIQSTKKPEPGAPRFRPLAKMTFFAYFTFLTKRVMIVPLFLPATPPPVAQLTFASFARIRACGRGGRAI